VFVLDVDDFRVFPRASNSILTNHINLKFEIIIQLQNPPHFFSFDKYLLLFLGFFVLFNRRLSRPWVLFGYTRYTYNQVLVINRDVTIEIHSIDTCQI